MLLSIDTSGKQGGISLARCVGKHCEILETSPIAGGTFSAQLVPQIAKTLSKHAVKAADLNGLVAISGPGSFTGLRVGLAAVKGLAEALRIPIISLSLLELMAEACQQKSRILAVLDAGRNECYCGEYDADTPPPRLLKEFLCSREELLNFRESKNFSIIACEDSLITLLQEHGISVTRVPRPDSALAIHSGFRKLLAGETIAVEQLDANYIRRSDAEIFSKPKIDAQKRSL
jgi:tRNA threonylcarbamoyladenosine biosynthesis protein TsaB